MTTCTTTVYPLNPLRRCCGSFCRTVDLGVGNGRNGQWIVLNNGTITYENFINSGNRCCNNGGSWFTHLIPPTCCLTIAALLVWKAEQSCAIMPIPQPRRNFFNAPTALRNIGIPSAFVVPRGNEKEKYLSAPKDNAVGSICSVGHPVLDGQPRLGSSSNVRDDEPTKVQNCDERCPPSFAPSFFPWGRELPQWFELQCRRTDFSNYHTTSSISRKIDGVEH